MRRKRLCAVLALLLLAAGGWGVSALRMYPCKAPECVLAYGDSPVLRVAGAGRILMGIPLPLGYGSLPCFAIGRDELYLWSSQRNALGVLTPGRGWRWVKCALPAGFCVRGTQAGADRQVYLNLFDNERHECWQVDSHSGVTRRVEAALECRASPWCAGIAVRKPGGGIELRELGGARMLYETQEAINLWAYDGKTDLLVFVNDTRGIEAFRQGRRVGQFRLGLLDNPIAICLTPDGSAVCLCTYLPFTARVDLVCFRLNGAFLGRQCGVPPMTTLVAPSPPQLELLRRLASGVGNSQAPPP